MKTENILLYTGSLAVLAGTVMGMANTPYACYTLGGGALLLLVMRFVYPVRTDNFRIRRLERLRFFGALLMVFAAYYLYKENNVWVLLLLIASVFEAIAAFRMPKK
ncbi:MAG: hypothetical protein IKR52_03750 [Paludibacteraceae bacterium]|nr:hypothetical protein [Paludibacteraceae bacterium]